MSKEIEHIEDLLSKGRYFEAKTAAEKELAGNGNLRLRQLHALATSKSGAPKLAIDSLEPVYHQHPDDPETAGILWGIYKEIFKRDQDTRYALQSRDVYLKNYQSTRNFYTGINAATMSAIAGQSSKGREIAQQLIQQLEQQPKGFWEIATLGEAYLLTKDRQAAMDHYFQARKLAGTDWGKIGSVYNQLWLLNHYVPVPSEILKNFSPPAVVSFVGHMIDHPSRTTPRFPAYIEPNVKEAIAGALRTLNAKIGYCSLACGGDIIFAEAMLEAGGELSVWIPFAKEDFIETSLRFAGEEWIQRFDRLVTQVPVHYLTQDRYDGHDDLFTFLSQVIYGSAIIRSTINHSTPYLLTVLSETDLKRKEGGTRDASSLWPYPQQHININPDQYHRPDVRLVQGNAPPPFHPPRTRDRPLLYCVTADFVGFTDEENRAWWKKFVEKSEWPLPAPEAFEEGAMLMACFTSIAGATNHLRRVLREVNAVRKGHQLRASLFANPLVLEPGSSPEMKKLSSASVARLKMFHELLSPGSVYALARFASVLSLDVKNFTLDYAGVLVAEGEPVSVDIFRVIMSGQGPS